LKSKLFYGNGVPACLLLLNKKKAPERKGKILMIWASRHFQKANPQNLLRPSDLMRILVPWRAFGDLDKALESVGEHEAHLIREVEENRDKRLADIEDAYGPVLEPYEKLETEKTLLDSLDLKVKAVYEAVSDDHPWFHPLVPLKDEMQRIKDEITVVGRGEKATLKARLSRPKAAYDAASKKLIAALKDRTKQVGKAVKELKKLQEERNEREQDIRLAAEREITHLKEAAADLRRILGDQDEARRYFAVVEKAEIEDNECNLNLPRYIDTFEPEKVIHLEDAVRQVNLAVRASDEAQEALGQVLVDLGLEWGGKN
jgi:type I restriction enzyme M protein